MDAFQATFLALDPCNWPDQVGARKRVAGRALYGDRAAGRRLGQGSTRLDATVNLRRLESERPIHVGDRGTGNSIARMYSDYGLH